MRIQFQLKHLLMLVFVAAVILADFRHGPILLPAVAMSIVLFGPAVWCADKVTRALLNLATELRDEKKDAFATVPAGRFILCVAAGVCTMFGIILVEVLLVSRFLDLR